MSDPSDFTDTPARSSVDVDMQHVDALRLAIAAGDGAVLRQLLSEEHPAELADRFEQLTAGERAMLVKLAPEVISPSVLAELEDEVVEDILPLLKPEQISKAMEELDSDDAIQIFEELPKDRRAQVLADLSEQDRKEIEDGFAFDEETAGRLMQREFVAAPEFWSVGQTIDHMRGQHRQGGGGQGESGQGGDNLPDKFFDIYVIDAHFHPLGYIPLSTLMRCERDQVLKDIMDTNLTVIEPDLDQEDVAYLFEKFNLISAPVLDADGRLSGMITVDDIVEIIQDEHTEDMLALAGVSEAGLVDTVWSTVGARAPWLFVNLLTAIGASLVIAQFQNEIEQLVALAVLMPIVASMGGNTGTQALTVAIRALATRDLTSANTLRVIRREALAAVVNGLIFAVVLGGITYVWFGQPKLALVIATALVFNLFCAGLAGILVPLGLKKIGADPAVASSVFVTTVTDVIGFLAFLGLASLFLL